MSISALKEKFNSLTLESENHWDYRGNNNSERDYVHGFCTYPAMMVPKMQREMLDVCLEHLQDILRHNRVKTSCHVPCIEDYSF